MSSFDKINTFLDNSSGQVNDIITANQTPLMFIVMTESVVISMTEFGTTKHSYSDFFLFLTEFLALVPDTRKTFEDREWRGLEA